MLSSCHQLPGLPQEQKKLTQDPGLSKAKSEWVQNFSWDDEKILEMDSGDACTRM